MPAARIVLDEAAPAEIGAARAAFADPVFFRRMASTIPPKAHLFAVIASVVFVPFTWIVSVCAGLASDRIGLLLLGSSILYALGFALAVAGLFGIPKLGTGTLLGLGLLGGVTNGFFLSLSLAAFVIFHFTYG